MTDLESTGFQDTCICIHSDDDDDDVVVEGNVSPRGGSKYGTTGNGADKTS